MQETDPCSSLIGDIYDTVPKPELWTRVLDKIRDFVGGCGAALFSNDAAGRTRNVYCDNGNLDDRFRQLVDMYIGLTPGAIAQIFAKTDEPFVRREMSWNVCSREKPGPSQSAVIPLICTIDRSPKSFTLLAVFCREDEYEQTLRRTQRFLPHIRRAIIIRQLIDVKTAEIATFAELLDGLSAGVLFVDGCGHIVRSNASADALLDRGTVLRVAGAKLAAVDAVGQRDLHDALSALGGSNMPGKAKVVTVPLVANDGERHIAHFLPLTSVGRPVGVQNVAVAAVFVRQATFGLSVPSEVFAKIFKLTPSESRVLFAIIETGTISQAANALGIRETTLKTHLQRVFLKTGTNRQAELVKLLTSYANPLL